MNPRVDISRHTPGGAAVVIILFSPRKILLIKETTKPRPHYLKLPSETFEPGESAMDALWAGLKEEAGFDVEVKRNKDGHIIAFTDPRVQKIQLMLPPEQVKSYHPHMRNVWGVLTTDEVIDSLDGQDLKPAENEQMTTHATLLSEVKNHPEIMPLHRELLQRAIAGT